jgi:hypothetical protein
MLWQGFVMTRREAGIVRPSGHRWLWIPPLTLIGLQIVSAAIPISWDCIVHGGRIGGISLSQPSDALAPIAAAVIFLDPVYEEVMFRGILQPLARRRWSPWPAIIVCALFFRASHTAIDGLWQLVMAVIFGWVRERSGSLAPAILLHMANNALCLYGRILVDWK